MLIFFMMLSLTGNAVLFLCLNSLFKKKHKKKKERKGEKKKKQKSIPDFFFCECTRILMSICICRPVIVLYCTKYLHCDYFPNETFLCLEFSSDVCNWSAGSSDILF